MPRSLFMRALGSPLLESSPSVTTYRVCLTETGVLIHVAVDTRTHEG